MLPPGILATDWRPKQRSVRPGYRCPYLLARDPGTENGALGLRHLCGRNLGFCGGARDRSCCLARRGYIHSIGGLGSSLRS